MFSSTNYANHPISSISEDDFCYPYSSLHSPLINYYEIDDWLCHLNHPFPSMQPNNTTSLVDTTSIYQTDANTARGIPNGILEGKSRRRRPLTRDRHTKISTAYGLRDRRMRLSYEVASEFFKLQDALGFDKASTTIKWLLMQSKDAIEELNQTSKEGILCSSSTSECDQGVENTTIPSSSYSGSKDQHKAKGTRHRNAFHPLVRQSREEARARARERTREKKMIKTRMLELEHEHEHESAKYPMTSSWAPFDQTGERSGSLSHNMKSSISKIEQPHSQRLDPFEAVEDFSSIPLAFTGNWGQLTSFSCQHNVQVCKEERAFTMLETTESETESDQDYLGESFSHSSDEFLFRLEFEGISPLAADPPEFLQDESSESDQMEEDEIDPDELSYEELIALGEIVGEESRGLSEEQISSSLHPYVCKNVDCKATIDRCVICQVEYDEGEEIVALQCEHPFHADCIAKWLQIKKVCPICSTEATMNQKSK